MSHMKTSLLRELSEALRNEDRKELFGLVAERVRTCMLDRDEAEVIADWFDRLARGDDPRKVLKGETRGRPKGSTGTKVLRSKEVRFPDHVDLCWRMRRAMAAGHAPEVVFGSFAKVYGVTPRHVREVWESTEPTLGADPELAK